MNFFEEINLSLLPEDQIILASNAYLRSKNIVSFKKDINHLKIIKRQLVRYGLSKKINLRLFLNNLILFFNSFDTSSGKVLIYNFITEPEFKSIIKTCLISILLMKDDEWIDIPISKWFETELKILLSSN